MAKENLHFYKDKTPLVEKLILVVAALFILTKDFIARVASELKMGYYTENGIKKIGQMGLKKILPHRWMALTIDGISYDPERPDEIKATKKIRKWDPLLKGHFPGNPIYRGVLLVECANLAFAAFVKLTINDITGLPANTGWDGKTKFRKPALPGDELIFIVTMVKNWEDKSFIFNCKTYNQNNDLIAEMKGLKGAVTKK